MPNVRRVALFASAVAFSVLGPMALAGSKTGASNRVRAAELLGSIDASASDELEMPIAKARALLARGATFRDAGDEVHAEAMDRAARAWSEYAATLGDVVATESSDAGLRKGPTVAEKKVLLDETLAQNARLRGELDRLEAEFARRDAGSKTAKPAKAPASKPASSGEMP